MIIFLSDTHFGHKQVDTKKYDRLIDSIYRLNPTTLMLLGDILDIWRMPMRQIFTVYNKYLQFIFKWHNPYYIIGNHDYDMLGIHKIGNIASMGLRYEMTLNDRKTTLIHGHQFDRTFRVDLHEQSKFIKFLSMLDNLFNTNLESKLTKMSLAKMILNDPKLNDKFLALSTDYAKQELSSIIICGHTHIPQMIVIDGIYYINCGDSVDHSTFVIYKDNTLILYDYIKDIELSRLYIK